MKNNNKSSFFKNLASDKASISVDFLFSFLIVMGLAYLILALSFTLSFIEITQYISFSTARSYYASHATKEEQRQQAENKYNELINNPVWAHFFNKISWFKIDNAENIIVSGNQSNTYTAQDHQGQPEMFTGASTFFISKLLAFSLPFIGSTSDEETTSGFETQISSFLGRAPSIKECQNFNDKRSEILQGSCLDCDNIKITSIADNGC